MRVIKLFFILSLFLSFVFFSAKTVRADNSEGLIELQNTRGQAEKCFAVSVLIQGYYNILITCRNLIYPIDNNQTAYMAWATPTKANAKPMRLGPLGYGKARFSTQQPFSDIFVTIEPSANQGQPTGPVIMRGSIMPISFLEQPIPPTSTPTPTPVPVISGSLSPTPTLAPGVPTPTGTSTQGTGSQVLGTLVKAAVTLGVVILFIIIVTIVILIIYRSRKSSV